MADARTRVRVSTAQKHSTHPIDQREDLLRLLSFEGARRLAQLCEVFEHSRRLGKIGEEVRIEPLLSETQKLVALCARLALTIATR